MGFLGIRRKEDTGLNPIVYRAPVTALPASSVSAYLVQPKAVIRTPPAPPPRVEPPAPPPPVPPVDRSAPAPARAAVPAVRSAAPSPAAPPVATPVAAPVAPAPPTLRPMAPRPVPLARATPAPATWGPPRSVLDMAYLRKGVVLQARGEHAEAIEQFTLAIQADSGCVEAYASRGISREVVGDVDGARADYAKSIEVEVKAGIAAHLAVAREIGI